ncbi:hypothetical protein E1B28_010746 [Marasmius oreades]|uniref:Uncharacterized protein n=1 Tax=Marasmius oreades TaxID=181124 RepID=A0A9P7RSL7_9AGAR|nr:uncharacterized protein E1B28_010746 [Marasmius oreades]KAG7089036.1 hypothetical protein E1B28_010746 [Marasmius oreades]
MLKRKRCTVDGIQACNGAGDLNPFVRYLATTPDALVQQESSARKETAREGGRRQENSMLLGPMILWISTNSSESRLEISTDDALLALPIREKIL